MSERGIIATKIPGSTFYFNIVKAASRMDFSAETLVSGDAPGRYVSCWKSPDLLMFDGEEPGLVGAGEAWIPGPGFVGKSPNCAPLPAGWNGATRKSRAYLGKLKLGTTKLWQIYVFQPE